MLGGTACGSTKHADLTQASRDSATSPSQGSASSPPISELTNGNPAIQCVKVGYTAPGSLEADQEANQAGNQFNGGPVNFDPAAQTMNGSHYAEYLCDKNGQISSSEMF
jgi:hypothetical protein